MEHWAAKGYETSSQLAGQGVRVLSVWRLMEVGAVQQHRYHHCNSNERGYLLYNNIATSC